MIQNSQVLKIRLISLLDLLPLDSLKLLTEFAEFLGARVKQSPSKQEATDDTLSLMNLIKEIQQTPSEAVDITWPTKSWQECVSALTLQPETAESGVNWLEQWDALEVAMEATSLAHEELEKAGNWNWLIR